MASAHLVPTQVTTFLANIFLRSSTERLSGLRFTRSTVRSSTTAPPSSLIQWSHASLASFSAAWYGLDAREALTMSFASVGVINSQTPLLHIRNDSSSRHKLY